MGKYWDWYEVEFERTSRRRLRPERSAEILDSLRDHVELSTQELAHKYKSLDQAERASERQLGSPSLIIQAECDHPRRQWLPMTVTAVGLTWCASWFVLSINKWSILMLIFGLVLTPIAVLFTSIWGKSLKLGRLTAMTVAFSVIAGFGFCFGWLNLNLAGGQGYISIWQVGNVAKSELRRLAGLEQDRLEIKQTWEAFRGHDFSLARDLVKDGNRYRVPMERDSPSGPVFTSVGSFDEARRVWRKELGLVLWPVDQEITRTKANLAAIKDTRSRNPGAMLASSGMAFAQICMILGSWLVIAHLLGVFIGSVPTRLARHRWRSAI